MGESTESTKSKRGLLKLLVFAGVVVAGVLLLRYTPLGGFLTRQGIQENVELLRDNPWAPLVFVPVYAAAVGLGMPGTVLTLAGGAVFGLWWGTLFNWMGATAGAVLAYLLARFLGREGIEDLLGDRTRRWPALEKLDRAVEEHGFRGLFSLRLIPLFPFNALNFGSGLLGMPLSSYALATALGIVPGTFVYTMFADALLEGSTEASREAFVRMAVSGGLLLLLSFLPTILERMGVRVPVTSGEDDKSRQ